MTRVASVVAPAIFGAVDGMTVVLGILLPLASRPSAIVFGAALGVAGAELVGMSAGEYLSDSQCSKSAAAAIGIAAFAGAILPALAFVAFPRPVRLWAGLAMIVLLGSLIATYRARARGRRAWLETFGLLSTAAAVCTALAVLAPS